ncbi:MAG: hypothetical protein WBO32_11905, partial [Cyclobacteriaceae bacterium]
MKTNITVIILWAVLLNSAFAQSLTLSYGPAYTTTKRVVPVMNGRDGKGYANAAYVFSLSYEHLLPKKPISFTVAYSKFKGYTQVFYEKGGVIRFGGEVASDGFSGVNVSRMDFGICYTLTKAKKKFYFTPYLSAGIQVSKKTGEEIYSELAKLDGPN